MNLPFQVIERVNETRATRSEKQATPAGHVGTLFDYWQVDRAQQTDASDGWRNKLIWGDNLYVMKPLLENFAGQIDLIYIDPPFATGTDFSFLEIGEEEEEIEKQQSIIEEKVYRDTWGRGDETYLTMMADRLLLDTGASVSRTGLLFLHCDWHVGHYLKLLCDQIFGRDRMVNELVWAYTGPGSPKMRQAIRN